MCHLVEPLLLARGRYKGSQRPSKRSPYGGIAQLQKVWRLTCAVQSAHVVMITYLYTVGIAIYFQRG